MHAKSVLQRPLIRVYFLSKTRRTSLQRAVKCCGVLRCVAVCCGVLRCVAAYIYTERPGETFSGTNLFNDSPNVDHVPVYALRYAENVSKCCSVLQCVAVLQGSYSSICAALCKKRVFCCSWWQCVAVCCSVFSMLHCVVAVIQ